MPPRIEGVETTKRTTRPARVRTLSTRPEAVSDQSLVVLASRRNCWSTPSEERDHICRVKVSKHDV